LPVLAALLLDPAMNLKLNLLSRNGTGAPAFLDKDF